MIDRLVAETERDEVPMFINSLKALVDKIPKSQTVAYSSSEREEWIAAEKRHLKLLVERNWADLVDLPPGGERAIPLKWVYNTKGKEEEKTARLDLLGFMQRYGIDYNEKFSPTVQWRVVRYLIALWTCFQLTGRSQKR